MRLIWKFATLEAFLLLFAGASFLIIGLSNDPFVDTLNPHDLGGYILPFRWFGSTLIMIGLFAIVGIVQSLYLSKERLSKLAKHGLQLFGTCLLIIAAAFMIIAWWMWTFGQRSFLDLSMYGLYWGRIGGEFVLASFFLFFWGVLAFMLNEWLVER